MNDHSGRDSLTDLDASPSQLKIRSGERTSAQARNISPVRARSVFLFISESAFGLGLGPSELWNQPARANLSPICCNCGGPVFDHPVLHLCVHASHNARKAFHLNNLRRAKVREIGCTSYPGQMGFSQSG